MSTTEDLEAKVELLEGWLYDTELYHSPDLLHERAWDIFEEVLDHYGLCYSNPGEPVAENEDRSVVIPLTSCNAGNNGGMRTDEEEEKEMLGEWELPSDLYWARLRLRQARDILEDGWQSGLKEPEEV